jgi:hypothetical protein
MGWNKIEPTIVTIVTVTRKCGHVEKCQDWQARDGGERLCSTCYAQAQEAKKQRLHTEAVAWAQELGLPALSGSGKQIALAETIRHTALREHPPERWGTALSRESAKWWIDHQDGGIACCEECHGYEGVALADCRLTIRSLCDACCTKLGGQRER